jgi:tetratricopeptide (TPR) repeat protein
MHKKKKYAQNIPVDTLQTQAAYLLAKGYHKKAIETYKQLLKKEQREQWQAELAKAYLLRAKELANKDMYKEAAVLWENRTNLCTDKAVIDQYIYWLIRAGRYIKAARLLADSAGLMPDNVRRELWAYIGALRLAGYQELANAFDQEADLLKHYELIKMALDAYYRGNDAVTENYLKKMPFRSPYRDFRPILKALLIIHFDQNGAYKLLNKVPTVSPYAHFAKLILLGREHEEVLLEGLSKLDHHEETFLAHLLGWDKEQLKVISMLQTTAKRDNFKELMEIVVDNRFAFAESYSQQFCVALLPSYPAGVSLYERIFGPLSAFEKNRITACSSERKGQYYTAERHWRLCIENLKKQIQKDEYTVLKIALILRHIVETTEKRGEAHNDEDVPNDLAESLRFDPDDKPSYIKLIQWYQHQNDKKEYQKWIDAAVKQFPYDSEILFLAIDAAISKKAFKKAVGFAKKLLKVDPINVKARQMAQFSHISHARKLIKSDKYSNARKELEQAAHFEIRRGHGGVLQINQGLLELQVEGIVKPKTRSTREEAQGGIEKGEPKRSKTTRSLNSPSEGFVNPISNSIELLQKGMQLAGGGLLGKFKVIVESKSQALLTIEIFSLIFPRNEPPPLPTQTEVLELVNLINIYMGDGVTFLKEAIDQIKESLQKAMKLDFSQKEMLCLCQCLKNVKHYLLLKQFAVSALKCWPKHSAFFYYQVYGKVEGDILRVSGPDMISLKQAIENAEQQDDKRTSTMIIGFLNQIGRMSTPFFNPFDRDDWEEDLERKENEKKELESALDENMPEPYDELRGFIEHLEKMEIDMPDFDGTPVSSEQGSKKKRKKS